MSMTPSGIFIDDGGQGEVPLLFLHSLAGSTEHWNDQLKAIRQTNRGITFDFAGHGRSKQIKDTPITLKAFVKNVEEVVGCLQLKQFILIGHSMGSAVAIDYACRYPDQVAGLMLVDPVGDSTQMPTEMVQQIISGLESPSAQEFIEGYWQQILTNATGQTYALVMQDLRETPMEIIVPILKELFNFNPLPLLQQYKGRKQLVISPSTESPVSLHKLDPTLSTKAIEETSHWLHLDRPEAFNAILNDFLVSV